MAKQSGFKDKVVFVILGVALVLLFLAWKGFQLSTGTGDRQTDLPTPLQNAENAKQNSDVPEQETSSLPVAKLFLGRRGVSEDQITWHGEEEFVDFIRQLQEKGVKEVHYTLLPDSIERYEEKWSRELKQANMRSYIETD